LRWLGDQSGRRRSVVEESPIPILSEFVHLQLEIIHHTFRFLAPNFQFTRGLHEADDAVVLALFRLVDEVVLAEFGVEDAAFLGEVGVGETLGDGIVNRSKACGEGVVDVGDALGEGLVDRREPLLEGAAAACESRIQLPIRLGEALRDLVLLLGEEAVHLVQQELGVRVHGATAPSEAGVMWMGWWGWRRRRWRVSQRRGSNRFARVPGNDGDQTRWERVDLNNPRRLQAINDSRKNREERKESVKSDTRCKQEDGEERNSKLEGESIEEQARIRD
jgi:hypothetical protein